LLKGQNQQRKEVKTMKYEKTNVLVLDAAIAAIQSHTAKTIVPNGDASTGFVSNSAYEADE